MNETLNYLIEKLKTAKHGVYFKRATEATVYYFPKTITLQELKQKINHD